jgi:hypothetical protein
MPLYRQHVDLVNDQSIDGAKTFLDDLSVTSTSTSNTTSSGALTVAGGVGIAENLNVGGDLTVDTNTFFVDATNNRVGIGTSIPTAELHISREGEDAVLYISASGSQVPATIGKGIINMRGGDASGFHGTSSITTEHASNGAGKLTFGVSAGALGGSSFVFNTGTVSMTASVSSTTTTSGTLVVTGGVGISENLNVGGALTATTKSFDIEHPTKENMRLRYGSLEGPENGVYVRGKGSNKTIIELPDYWTGLIDEDTITVALTPIGGHNDLWVEKIKDNKVYIQLAYPGEYFYHIFAERKDVDKLIVEYNI